MEFRISDLGMFTEKRRLLELDTYVAFCASEIMMSGLRSGFLETTVTACDGAGTVIASDPALVQGIGRQNVRPCRNRANRRHYKWDPKTRRNRARP